MLLFTATVLRQEGHEVVTASSVTEANKILDSHPHRESLCLVVDVVLDHESGIAFAEDVTNRYAGVRVLLISGFTDDVLVMKAESSNRTAFLAKPFTKEELMAALDRLCA